MRVTATCGSRKLSTVSRSQREAAAVVGQEQFLDAVPTRAQFGQRLRGGGGAFAGPRNLAATGNVELHVAVVSQHPHRQWRCLAVTDVEPVEHDLVELVARVELVRDAHHHFLGTDGVRGACQSVHRFIRRDDHREDGLARVLGEVDDGGQQARSSSVMVGMKSALAGG